MKVWHSRLWAAVLNKLKRAEAELSVLEPQIGGPPHTLAAGALLALVNRTAALLRPHLLEVSGSPDPAASLPLVGLYLTNSALYVAAVLAALQCGAAFLPLDPRWPSHRLHQVLADAQPAALLWAAEDLAGGHGPPPGPASMTLVELTAELLESCTALDQPPTVRLAAAVEAAETEGCPLPYCYVLFTSGSTGAPLGVCGTEEGIFNRCQWMQHAYPLQPGDRVAFKTSPCFVDSIWEVFGPLLAGVPLVALPQGALARPHQLLDLCVAHRITHLAAVPTLWKGVTAVLEAAPNLAAGLALRVAVSSGEPLDLALLTRMQSVLPWSATVLNLYGSTEVAADCTAFDCTHWRGSGQRMPPLAATAGSMSVGTPIAGMWVGVVSCGWNEEAEEAVPGAASGPGDGEQPHKSPLRFLPTGSVGELVVGGVGLAAGYLNHPKATARRFVEVPLGVLPENVQQHGVALGAAGAAAAVGQGAEVARAGQGVSAAGGAGGRGGHSCARLFRTGDLGALDEQGRLWLHGRKDLQVKISGVRFDLTEIEAVLCQHPAVHAAAARLWTLRAGPALAAYVELHLAPAQRTHQPIEEQLLEWCQQRLLPAAQPRTVVILGQLPRSAAGKVQRAALPLPAGWQAAEGGGALEQLGQQQGSWSVMAHDGLVSEAGQGSSNRDARPAKRPRPPPLLSPAAPASQQPAAVGASPAIRSSCQPPISEAQVARAFAAALQGFLPADGATAALEPSTNIFRLGANSLAVAAIAEALGCPVELVYQCPTVRSLAASLRAAGTAAGERPRRQRQGEQQEGQQLGTVEGGRRRGDDAGPRTLGGVLQLARALELGSASATTEGAGGDANKGAVGAGLRAGEAGAVGARRRPQLGLAWRSRLLQCVDAPPLPALVSGSERVYGCSHGGDVCCFDAASGARLWSVVLPDRADVGMALCSMPAGDELWERGWEHGGAGVGDTSPQAPIMPPPCGSRQCLSVGTNGGTVFFLEASSGGSMLLITVRCAVLCLAGGMLGSVDTGGSLRAPPAKDPWRGMLWVANHAKQLLVLAPPGVVLARHACPAAVSAQVAFHLQLGLAFIACLDGTLVALRAAYLTLPGQEEAGSSGGLTISSSPQLQPAWQHQCSAPLFVPPLVVESSAKGTEGQRCALVLAAAVDGSVSALEAASGRLAWRCQAGAAVFTPLVQLSMRSAALDSGSGEGGRVRAPNPQQGQEQGQGQQQQWGSPLEACVLVGTQAGDLCALDALSGQTVSRLALAAKVTGICALPQAAPCALPPLRPLDGLGGQLLLVSTQPGALCLLSAAALLLGASMTGSSAAAGEPLGAELQRDESEMCGYSASEGGGCELGLAGCMVDVAKLPGEVFSLPVAARGGAAVGCRDDHLYCLSIN